MTSWSLWAASTAALVALLAGLEDVEEDFEDIEDVSIEPLLLPPQAVRIRDRAPAAPRALRRVAVRVVVRMRGTAP